MLDSLLAAAAGFMISSWQILNYGPNIPAPAVSLSAVREILCDGGNGTGWLVKENILATALHVADAGNCKDGQTGVPLKTYVKDPAHDFALMTGKLAVTYYMKYDCNPFTAGATTTVIGYRSRQFRMEYLTATPYYTGPDYKVEGTKMPGMRTHNGVSVPGNSGGPVLQGNVVRGIVNVGAWNRFGDPVKLRTYELKDTPLCR